MSTQRKTATPKIRKLAEVAERLRHGEDFSITRLTTVKNLCRDPEAAAHFVLHLSRLTLKRMRKQSCPTHTDAATWRYCKRLVVEALARMEHSLQKGEKEPTLWELLAKVRAVNGKLKYLRGGPVRIIESTEVLLVENALHCLLRPSESAHWAYQTARQYAERYDSRYGQGLIPESAPRVEEIADFWCQKLLDMPLRKWLGAEQNGKD